MRTRWSREARDDVVEAGRYVASDDAVSAARLVRRLTATARTIAAHPEIGRLGRVSTTRGFIVPGTSYIVVYRITGGEVQIARGFTRPGLGPQPFERSS